MSTRSGIAALMLCVSAAMSPIASAQISAELEVPGILSPEAAESLNCVLDALSSEDRNAVVNSYFARDSIEVNSAGGLLAVASDVCEDRYGLSEAQERLMVGFAQNRSIIGKLTGEVVADGMRDDDTIEAVWRAMVPTDRARLLDSRWTVNPVLRAQTEMALIEAGVPNKLGTMTDALIVLEAYSHVAAITGRWAELAEE